ncbi:hypothetical protein [Falsiroseomonas selenitidurans]|uniref:Uncharacterized protein n=1 Tax=Falsiroseomonas selenitidurans TaxID=2716335 RepID=A0ABX1DZ79_9PROT|nr:hypothetical protein [Falsiroseomonas selenitidurans]NKC30214.1 hypothetical protein [Falsiroseomonas selenitidurans]
MTQTARQLERYLATIRAIARSPDVREYIVGYTSNVTNRQAAYRGVKMPHLVVLAAEMLQDDALDLESALQTAIKDGDKRSLLFRKYNGPRISRPNARSRGAKRLPVGDRSSAVYVAWAAELSALAE